MCALLISECCIDFLRSEIECGVDKPRPLAKPNLIKISNKYPPAKPGVFLMRAKPYVASHASCGVGTV